MTTLVVCVDRANDIGRNAGVETPVVGWDGVESLITRVGIVDPEDSIVNCLLEALRVTRGIEEAGEAATVAAITGSAETLVGADRSIADQMDVLVERTGAESVILVIDSAEDERVVPIVESRVRIDSVDRVVVRQAHDLESTYYLLKQFLADEELRGTILVPIGITLLVFPIISFIAGTGLAVAAITASIGGFLVYKGMGLDEHVEDLPARASEAFYSGRVSIVTYVVGAGLALVGVFAGLLGVSGTGQTGVIVTSMAFVYHSVPWLALSALAASTGRLIDEAIRSERLSGAYLNLPFGVIATGVVVRGFSAYFLQRSGEIEPLVAPHVEIGTLSAPAFPLTPEERLAVFVVVGVLISIVGVRIAAYFSGASLVDREVVD